MAVNFYDVLFNHYVDTIEDSWIPAISGYIIDDEGYNNRTSEYDGEIPSEHLISWASGTNNIQGAMTMSRGPVPLRPNDEGGFITMENTASGVKVSILNQDKTEKESLILPIPENGNSVSLVGHFNVNDELDWVSIGCSVRNSETNERYLQLNTIGFSSSVMNAMKPYVYLQYKYNYQVTIQKSLRGSNNFELARFPDSWYTRKIYGTGEGQSNKFNETVCRLDPSPEYSDVYDESAVWLRVPPISTAPSWWQGRNAYSLPLKMAQYLESAGDSFGSDLFHILPDGKFYSGIDLDSNNLSWRTISSSGGDYEIPFQGGYIRLQYHSYYRWVQILDSEKNILDEWQMPYPVSGGGSGIPTGNTANANYPVVMNGYISEHNGKYYLFMYYQSHSFYDDNAEQIVLSDSTWGTYSIADSYQLVHIFNAQAQNVLAKATKAEEIVPVDPDSLTADDNSNQTTDPEYINEYGEEIPTPKYTTGEFDDGTTEGVRGSGEGSATGENSQKTLDEQPDTPGEPTIPTSVSTGFMRLYAPTETEIASLCEELTDNTILETLKKYFGNNPLDFIVGLQVVPGSYTQGTTKKKIKYGSFTSNIGMFPITDEFTTIDYGTLNLKEIYGSWEDYNPHTKMSIYLPYIGIKEIDPDRINGTELHLKYYIDAITGSILAVLTSVRVDSQNPGAEILVGQWGGQATYTIPLTNTQHNSAVNAVIGVVSAGVSLGVGLATGGGSTALQIAGASAIGNMALSGAKSGKTDITMQGAVSGNLAFFTGKDAYVQITYPVEGRPNNYDHINGMPSNITTSIRQQPMGYYIEFSDIDIDGINAPKDEKEMIKSLLTGGVYT